MAHRAPGAVAGFGRGGVGRCRVGLVFAQNQLEQRGFARAVGPEQADLVATQNSGGKVANDDFVAKSLGHVGEFGNQLATGGAAVDVHIDAADHFAAGFAAGAQIVQAHDAGGGAGAAGFHAFADPHLFLRQQLVGAGVDHRLLGQLFFSLQQIGGKVAWVGQELAPVQLHNAGGHVVQKRAVVGDGDDAALEVDQQTLQPLDRVQVQVVGRLVEQQHLRLRHQGLRQRNPFFSAAGERADHRVGVQVQAVKRFCDSLLPVPAVQRLDFALHGVQVAVALAILFNQMAHTLQAHADRLKHRGLRVQAGFLGHIGDAGVALYLQHAVVGLFHAGKDFEHGGLARAIAANQANALGRF